MASSDAAYRTPGLELARIDLDDARHARDLIELLDRYALDPMGGGRPLPAAARERLVAQLRAVAHFRGALAYLAGADGQARAAGLIHCFMGFSTFAARPLLNVHDLVVRAECRGLGVGRALLDWAEELARRSGCCKLTLEVLSNNARALALYRGAGYGAYELDPAAGQAVVLQKLLTPD